MQGIFVTDTYEMVLASTHDGVSVLYRADDAVVGNVDDMGNVTVETTPGTVHRGVYDGHGQVRWNDGTSWTRVALSEAQYRVLTYRPYTPMTFLFIRFVQTLCRRLFWIRA